MQSLLEHAAILCLNAVDDDEMRTRGEEVCESRGGRPVFSPPLGPTSGRGRASRYMTSCASK